MDVNIFVSKTRLLKGRLGPGRLRSRREVPVESHIPDMPNSRQTQPQCILGIPTSHTSGTCSQLVDGDTIRTATACVPSRRAQAQGRQWQGPWSRCWPAQGRRW